MERYRSLVYDSNRWEGFELRPGDIIVSTPPKCGTTWTQMILAQLILQEPVLPAPLTVISPWLDHQGRARRDVMADLEAQTHRRFLKTHTPLDGLPHDRRVTYVCVGRDLRDVAVSMDNHHDNLDVESFLRTRAAAAAIDGLELPPPPPPLRHVDDPRERFWAWVDDERPPTEVGSSLLRTLRHLESFTAAPSDLDVVLLRYEDLSADLEAQMRALAARLDLDVDESKWSALVAAATFDRMRARADVVAPGAEMGNWKDPRRFFHEGRSGQWRALLDQPGDAARYRARAEAIGPPEVVAWAHPTGL